MNYNLPIKKIVMIWVSEWMNESINQSTGRLEKYGIIYGFKIPSHKILINSNGKIVAL